MDDLAPRPERPASSLGQIGLERFAPYLMNRIMGRYNAGLREALAAQGLTTPQMRTLAVLSVAGNLSINELSVYAVIEQSTMSRTLDALEGAGLVRRREDPDDSRTRRVSLTEEGREAFDRIWPALAAAERALFEGIPDDERDRFVSTLGRVLRNVRVHPF